MLESQTLYATHYAFLNDQEEIIRFKGALKSIMIPKLKKEIENWLEKGKLDKDAVRKEGGVLRICNLEIETLVDILYRSLLDNGKSGVAIPFIFSFCSHSKDKRKSQDGLLSQWRGYAKEGGLAIVFETIKLESLMRLEAEARTYSPFGWGDVVYQGDEKKLEIELGEFIKIISDFLLLTTHARAFKTAIPSAMDKEFMAHAACVALFKHRGFEEENEVRIYAYRPCDRVVAKTKNDGKSPLKPQAEIQKNKHGRPYIELFKGLGTLPIKRIIVGPQKNKEAVAHELRNDAKLKNIPISVSDIPYVEQSWNA